MGILHSPLSIPCHDVQSSHPDLGSPWALFTLIPLEMPFCPTACLLTGPALSPPLCPEQKQPYAILRVSLLALSALAGVAAANCVLCCLPLDCELLAGRDHMVSLYLLWHLTVPCTW